MTRACERCGTYIRVADELEDAAIQVLCPSCLSAIEGEALARRRAKVGAPGPLAGYTFASIDRPDGIEQGIALARGWAAGEVQLAGFEGPFGTGKTRVAVAAANELATKRPVRFFSAPDLLARLGSGRLDAPARTATINVLLSNIALVLDDLDKARPTEYAAETLFLAIDARVEGSAPLLITTNLSLRELAERWPQPYGEAIASRLLLAEWADFEGADKRAKSTP